MRGFSFAVLEGERLVDWGGREVVGDVSVFLDKLDALMRRYRPDALVLEEPADSRRGKRARDWLAWAEELAGKRELEARALAWESVLGIFGGVGQTRHAVAVAVSRLFPELSPYLPRRRRPWQGEPARLGVFIAVARALALRRPDVKVAEAA